MRVASGVAATCYGWDEPSPGAGLIAVARDLRMTHARATSQLVHAVQNTLRSDRSPTRRLTYE